jgi:hypothetical protein
MSANKDGFDGSAIHRTICKKNKHHRGFIFKEISPTLIHGYQLTQLEIISKKPIYKKVQVNIYDLNNNLIKSYNSIKDSKIDGFDGGAIDQCIKGTIKSHRGFKFIRTSNTTINGYKLNDNELNNIAIKSRECIEVKLEIYDVSNQLIQSFKSLIEATRDGKFNNNGILNCISGRIKYHNGHTFKRISPTLVHGYPINK